MARPRKPKVQQAVKITISMPMLMFGKATERQQDRGLQNFSAYIQALVHSDQPKQHVEVAA